jgi:probable F420-dependent oxidoreductase
MLWSPRHHVGVNSTSEQHPFRFSLQAVQATSRQQWLELVRHADGAGFDMLVTADHVGGCMSPLLPLAIAAEVSERLRLGVMVLNNDFYHPSLLARSAATLDLLSDGRFELGMGAGHAKPEYDRAGLAFDPAGTRVGRLEEAVIVLRNLLDGQTVTFTGAHYRLVQESCDPRPLQQNLPLLVGGGGRRVHRIAAQHADTVGFTGVGRTLDDGQRHDPSGVHPDRVEEDVAAVRAAAAQRSSPPELQVLVQGVVVTDDGYGAAQEISRTRLPSLEPDDVLATPYVMVGSTSFLIDRLMEQRERWGFSHYTVRQDALGQLEPVIAALAGR